MLADLTRAIRPLVDDYELIVVENGSSDGSVAALEALTGDGGLPNLQVYALTKKVDSDTVAWVGLENALGDFIAVIDPIVDDISFLSEMLEHAVRGVDIVYASNQNKPRQSVAYHICRSAFNAVFKSLSGVHLANEASQYRLLSKRVVNFILQHPLPALTYRRLPATGGFSKAYLPYHYQPTDAHRKRMAHSVDQSLRLLVSTARGPLRLLTTASCLGALLSLAFSISELVRALVKKRRPAGWLVLSFQQSGMMLLGSLVQLMLGEYVLQIASLSSEGPPYHVADEFTSSLITRRGKLNVEAASSSRDPDDTAETGITIA